MGSESSPSGQETEVDQPVAHRRLDHLEPAREGPDELLGITWCCGGRLDDHLFWHEERGGKSISLHLLAVGGLTGHTIPKINSYRCVQNERSPAVQL